MSIKNPLRYPELSLNYMTIFVIDYCRTSNRLYFYEPLKLVRRCIIIALRT